jgi:hypothetical protein
MNHVANVHDLEQAHGVTWAELAELEPLLADLLRRARTAGAGCGGWEDAGRLFAPFRDAVAELVGFRCRRSTHAVLGSVGAYEVAYWRLYDGVVGLLPRLEGVPGSTEATAPRAHRGDDRAA